MQGIGYLGAYITKFYFTRKWVDIWLSPNFDLIQCRRPSFNLYLHSVRLF